MTHPLILHINNSKLFAGCIMILMNLGGKYVSKDVSRAADNILDTKLTRRFLIFCIAFVATRDVISSLIIMLLFIVIFSYFLNENSNYFSPTIILIGGEYTLQGGNNSILNKLKNNTNIHNLTIFSIDEFVKWIKES